MPVKTLPAAPATKDLGYYDESNPGALTGPVSGGAEVATVAALEAGIKAGDVCVFCWDEREAVAAQLGIDL